MVQSALFARAAGWFRLERRGEMRQYAERLLALRLAAGITLRQLATATGISSGFLSHMERGKIASPSPRKLAALAKYYGVAYGDLMAQAGYERSGGVSAKTGPFGKLSAEEETALLSFLGYFRRTKKQGTTA
jgi:transcriptional regulator with XRE-family HTH domain